ncbi:major histocompatibility complex, class I-related [Rhinolophus ferrumequinum]|uniref:Major histocompatibility complex, class I-related n=1 Tax=Rhinolophus ferrumequinum TaxID=59479 RepID=A0A7J7SYH7_RHIFE|nr:major histocompatibility complex, class I-related [Rhinolophus ferrumequinum]
MEWASEPGEEGPKVRGTWKGPRGPQTVAPTAPQAFFSAPATPSSMWEWDGPHSVITEGLGTPLLPHREHTPG